MDLLLVVIGGMLTLAGVAYAEWRRDRRESRNRRRDERRATLGQTRDTYLEWEAAFSDLFLGRVAEWNAERTWSTGEQTSPAWRLYAEVSRQLTALRSELENRVLATEIEAIQDESRAILTDGPVSASEGDSKAFKARVNERNTNAFAVIEAIGTEYRRLTS